VSDLEGLFRAAWQGLDGRTDFGAELSRMSLSASGMSPPGGELDDIIEEVLEIDESLEIW